MKTATFLKSSFNLSSSDVIAKQNSSLLGMLVAFLLPSTAITGLGQIPNDLAFTTLATDRKVYSYHPPTFGLTLHASNTIGSGTTFQELHGIAWNGAGVYVADFLRNAVFEVDIQTHSRSQVLTATRADVVALFRAQGYSGFVVSSILTDTQTQVLLRIESPISQTISLGFFTDVSDIAVDLNGLIYISAPEFDRIYTYNPFTGTRTQLTTTGVALQNAGGLAFYDTQTLLITDITDNSVLAMNTASKVITRISKSNVRGSGPAFSTPTDIDVDGNGRIIVLDTNGSHTFYEVDFATGNRSSLGHVTDTSGYFSIVDRKPEESTLRILERTSAGAVTLERSVAPRRLFRLYGSEDLKNWSLIIDWTASLRETSNLPTVTTNLPNAFFRLETQ